MWCSNYDIGYWLVRSNIPFWSVMWCDQKGSREVSKPYWHWYWYKTVALNWYKKWHMFPWLQVRAFWKRVRTKECFWHFASHRHASHIYLPLTCLSYLLVYYSFNLLRFHNLTKVVSTSIPLIIVETVTRLVDIEQDGGNVSTSTRSHVKPIIKERL